MSDLPLAELAALGAAICWTFTAILATPGVHHFGAVAFNRYRVVFAATVLIMGLWSNMTDSAVIALIGSSLVGVVGDTALMQALKHIGPRRN